MYQVTDTRTNRHFGTFETSNEARRMADHLDTAYGAVRYIVVISGAVKLSKAQQVVSDRIRDAILTRDQNRDNARRLGQPVIQRS